MTTPPPNETESDLAVWSAKINQILTGYPDKGWNYSRISLTVNPLKMLDTPFVLWVELIDTRSEVGQRELRTYSDEVAWGNRHSDELGMLELVSLRINKALLEITSDESLDNLRPVVRVRKWQDIEQEGAKLALWYQVSEVTGDDFDNR